VQTVRLGADSHRRLGAPGLIRVEGITQDSPGRDWIFGEGNFGAIYAPKDDD
jgi:hypothetical protein